MKKLLAGCALALAWVAPAISAEATTSWQGDDYSFNYNDRQNLKTCDIEHDSHTVAGEGDVDGNLTQDSRVVDPSDGGACATRQMAWSPGKIFHHRTCENIPVWPDPCGGWQAT